MSTDGNTPPSRSAARPAGIGPRQRAPGPLQSGARRG